MHHLELLGGVCLVFLCYRRPFIYPLLCLAFNVRRAGMVDMAQGIQAIDNFLFALVFLFV
jgi:hypothetical protein